MIRSSIVVLCLFICGGNCLSWQDCGGEGSLITVQGIDFGGDTVRISSNEPMIFSANMTQWYDVPEDAQVSFKIWKELKVLGLKQKIPLPCFNGFGTCKQSLCDTMKTHRGLSCAIIRASGRECNCPPSAGQYISKNVNYQVDYSKVPKFLVGLGNGPYKVEMRVKSQEKTIGCLNMQVKLKFN